MFACMRVRLQGRAQGARRRTVSTRCGPTRRTRVHQAAEGKEEQQAARLVDGLAPVDLGRLYDLAAVRCRHLLRVGDPRVVGEDALHM